jgi:hypothetical protein
LETFLLHLFIKRIWHKQQPTTDVQLSDQKQTVPIYKAPGYTKDAANEFIIDFFNRMHLDTSDMEIISYRDDGIYWIRGEESYNIGFRYLDGSYNYTDFSSFGEDKERQDVDEETLKESLAKFSIELPQDSQFQKIDTDTCEWTVDQKVIGNQLLNQVKLEDIDNEMNYNGTHSNLDERFLFKDKNS